MKRKVGVILLTALCGSIIAGSELAQTRQDVEKQVIASVRSLEMVVWSSDFFTWDDYIKAGSALVNKALERYPESVRLHECLQYLTLRKLSDPRLYIEKQPIKDSLVNYYKALYEANPKSGAYAYLYGRVLDDPGKSLEIAEKAIKSDRHSYWGYYIKGYSLIDLKRYEDAEKAYRKALEMDSTQFDAYADLAMVYYYLQKPDEVVSAAINAYRFAPHPYMAFSAYSLAQRLVDKAEDKQKLLELAQLAFKKLSPDQEQTMQSMYLHIEGVYKAYRAVDQPDSARLYLDYMDAYAAPISGWVEKESILDRAGFEALQGNTKEALDLLSKLADEGYTEYGYVMDQKELVPLQGNPGMTEILERMKANAFKKLKDSLMTKPAPDFTLVSIEGDTVNLSGMRGKVVILDFWGIGCGPCYMLMPVIEKFYQAHRGELYIYGIESWNNPPDKIKETLAKFGWTYPNLVGSAEVSKLYGVTGVPSMFVIDKKGNIRSSHVGFSPGKGVAQQMYDKLEWLLEELG